MPMSHVAHEITEEFPEHAALISCLKQSDAHFARLLEDYHEVNREIHRAETFISPTSQMREEALRKKRLALKDEIWAMLRAAAG